MYCYGLGTNSYWSCASETDDFTYMFVSQRYMHENFPLVCSAYTREITVPKLLSSPEPEDPEKREPVVVIESIE